MAAAVVARRVASRIPSALVSSPAASAAVDTASNTCEALASPSTILLPGQDKVICRWWRGMDAPPVVDPTRYLIDGEGKLSAADIYDTNSMLASEMKTKYADTGLCHVTNTGLTDMAVQRDMARILMGNETEYEGGANPRGRDADLGNVCTY